MTKEQFYEMRNRMGFEREHGVTQCAPGNAVTSSITFGRPRYRVDTNVPSGQLTSGATHVGHQRMHWWL